MKVLHTADWHLGHKLYNADREAEHQAALDALIGYIQQENIELLIIAGDVFDTDMPPNYARKQYYNFLVQLTTTPCQQVVIVAGNHDSANMLDASSDILKLLNVYVVGNLPSNRQEQIIELRDAQNELCAIVAAVPYLRDRDIRKGVPGQSIEERLQSLREGIEKHYQEIEAALQAYQHLDIPIICTGHLYVSGGERDGRQNSIHIGSLDVIDVDCFPQSADYIALGHLHRPQKVAQLNHVRYAGSLIPMDFNEWNYEQVCLMLEFEGKTLKKVKSLKIPLIRQLKFYRGTLEYIKEKLINIEVADALKTWVKVELLTNSFIPQLESDLNALLENKNAELMILKQVADLGEGTGEQASQQTFYNLAEMEATEVFQMRLDAVGINEEEKRKEMQDSFIELLTWMQEKDHE